MKLSPGKFPLWFLFVLVVVLFLQYPYIDEFPSFTHAWAQADRYALALGFLHNHFDFFHPQTYNLNPQFPGWFAIPNNHGITAVDFPIIEYGVALLMKLTDHTDPWCFRVVMLIISCTGLYFIYKMALLYLKEEWKAAMVSIGVATAPVFNFYLSGFLPSIPGTAIVWIGLYFYFYSKEKVDRISFYKAILFLTLATLIRTPAAIFLITITCNEVLMLWLKKDKINWTKVSAVFLSFISIVAYAVYNSYLRREYGSIFLAEPVPAKSWEKAKEVLMDVYHQWTFHYFTIWHYFFFFFILVTVIILLATKTLRPKVLQNPLFNVSVISLAGATLYAGLMLKQFVNHDYYFIDTFFTPVILVFMYLLSITPAFNKIKWATYLVVAGGILLMIKGAYAVQQERRTHWDKTDQVRVDFYDSAPFLDSLQIGKDAKITVVDAGAPNLAFILMDRKGYAIINTSPSIIETALTWDADAVVVENSSMTELLNMYPAFPVEWRCVGDNGKISVFKRYKYIANQVVI